MEDSLSWFVAMNGKECSFKDENGKILQGTNVAIGFNGSKIDVILRTNDRGLLDGGNLPAVEAPGHLEYWREGKLHREFGLPAVSAKGFTVNEFWENGRFIKKERK